MRCPLLTLATAAILYAQPNTLTPEQAAQGWKLLFDGQSLTGWTPEGNAKWAVRDGALTGESGTYGWLRYNGVFGNFELHCEFKIEAGGNSGIFLRSSSGGAPHLTGYEVQIFDGHDTYPTGSLVGYAAAKGAATKPDEWQSFDIVAVGSQIGIKLDGRPLVFVRDGKSAAGHIGLQFSREKKVQFRNIWVRQLLLQPPSRT